jgi:hypothetical protein
MRRVANKRQKMTDAEKIAFINLKNNKNGGEHGNQDE